MTKWTKMMNGLTIKAINKAFNLNQRKKYQLLERLNNLKKQLKKLFSEQSNGGTFIKREI